MVVNNIHPCVSSAECRGDLQSRMLREVLPGEHWKSSEMQEDHILLHTQHIPVCQESLPCIKGWPSATPSWHHPSQLCRDLLDLPGALNLPFLSTQTVKEMKGRYWKEDYFAVTEMILLRENITDRYKNDMKDEPLWIVLAGGSDVRWSVCCLFLLRNPAQVSSARCCRPLHQSSSGRCGQWPRKSQKVPVATNFIQNCD